MKAIDLETTVATVQLSRQELIILANSINESLEAIADQEYMTRVGAEVQEARLLGKVLRVLLQEMCDMDKKHS